MKSGREENDGEAISIVRYVSANVSRTLIRTNITTRMMKHDKTGGCDDCDDDDNKDEDEDGDDEDDDGDDGDDDDDDDDDDEDDDNNN